MESMRALRPFMGLSQGMRAVLLLLALALAAGQDHVSEQGKGAGACLFISGSVFRSSALQSSLQQSFRLYRRTCSFVQGTLRWATSAEFLARHVALPSSCGKTETLKTATGRHQQLGTLTSWCKATRPAGVLPTSPGVLRHHQAAVPTWRHSLSVHARATHLQ